jgi:hypothetical protein
MHICSTAQHNWNLFLAVDSRSTPHGTVADFAFRDELQTEALNMLSALPIFLQVSLGRQVWKWFTSEAKDIASEFKWDMDRGIVSRSTSATTNIQLENWEQLDDVDDEDDGQELGRIIQPFTLDLSRLGSNAYNDDGTIRTLALIPNKPPSKPSQSKPVHNVDDDSDNNTDNDTNDDPPSDSDTDMSEPHDTAGTVTQSSTDPSSLTDFTDTEALITAVKANPSLRAALHALLIAPPSEFGDQSANDAQTGTAANES